MSNHIFSSHTTLSDRVLDRYMALPIPEGKIQAEYVWLGGSGHDFRCKTRTLTNYPTTAADLPHWNFDGSSTGQAPGDDSEVLLRPVYFCPDPFRPGAKNIVVMCDCWKPNGEPIDGNTRAYCEANMNKVTSPDNDIVPWFGIEQEYTLFEADGVTPFGWPKAGFPGPQGPYYCSVGTENSYGRHIVEAHYRCCLYANLMISGINGEVMPGQWEYQIGPAVGLDSGDELMLSRFFLVRVCEAFQIIVSLDPKPIPGDWNGAGCHTNFSSKKMRDPNGYAEIIRALEKLKMRHAEHIAAYGEGNERRLTGRHETANINTFSYGVANRGCSCRIPRSTERDGCGYFEDRRPASNMDPYIVTGRIIQTIYNEG